MNRGEIWRANLPGGQGHVQAGLRPVILLQGDQFTAKVPTILVVPLSGQIATNRFPGTLVIQPDQQNGLTTASVALVFQMRVLDQRALISKIGDLDPMTLDQVVATLHTLIT